MDVGEVAANFLQSIRACFPTLVKKNPMTSAVDNSDSDSDQEDAYKKQKHAKDAQPAFDCKVAKAHRLAAEAKMSMSLIKVKFLRTLEDLFDAFQISDPANVRTSLRNDPSVPNDCQLLCLDCPPFRNIENVPYKAVPHVSSLTFASPDPFNIGVLYSEVITSNKKKQFLHIPIPRSLSHSAPGVQGQSETQYTFQDATVLSFDAKRESTAHGGGKTCEELVKNIRMRHASGTFCTLVLPSKTWEEVADEHKSFLPQVDELQGELRLRRLVGNVPCGVPIKFLLAS
ncbi:uncharacterized protein PHALS_02367 [Plasmopara halstedii]|uniref:Uncharacterized protein n=1 Tax=Plasmopara halstedii TaxID=4781 RepID=A0A0P1AW65_PLAHL|nr:uncharacterized protein PHALS_02367 [Plasmopara halstedii]CEG46044.1 hypothetical protein PHALS_02367 [Plasmopara halstedii]|eukprot:XP_024582413.1 hypothetical protein PHALS_02367 [Plasmopara halstedii]